jgi:hypothetical protein
MLSWFSFRKPAFSGAKLTKMSQSELLTKFAILESYRGRMQEKLLVSKRPGTVRGTFIRRRALVEKDV